jgi:hypothetical protein
VVVRFVGAEGLAANASATSRARSPNHTAAAAHAEQEVIEMSKNEDQTSPIFTAVRSTGVLRKNERAIDRILRVLVIKTTVTEDDLEAVQNILDSNITIRRAGGSTKILSVASAFGCNDLFIRVYLAISPARVEPEALVIPC